MAVITSEAALHSVKEMWKISVGVFVKWIDPVFTQENNLM